MKIIIINNYFSIFLVLYFKCNKLFLGIICIKFILNKRYEVVVYNLKNNSIKKNNY